MTVKELKEILNNMNDDVDIFVRSNSCLDSIICILSTDIKPSEEYNPEEWSNWFNMDNDKIKNILIF